MSGSYSLCQPCGECRECRKEGAKHWELLRLRRWKQRVFKLLDEVEKVLYFADPEREQPAVKRIKRRIKALRRSKT